MKLAEQIAKAAFEADTRAKWENIDEPRRAAMTRAVAAVLAASPGDAAPLPEIERKPAPERVGEISLLLCRAMAGPVWL